MAQPTMELRCGNWTQAGTIPDEFKLEELRNKLRDSTSRLISMTEKSIFAEMGDLAVILMHVDSVAVTVLSVSGKNKLAVAAAWDKLVA